MRVLYAHNGVEYGPLDEETLAGTIQCISDVFVQGEPMTKHLGISRDEFVHFAEAAYPSIAEEGLSFVARDAETHEVIGCRISEDFVQDEPPEIPGLSPKFFPLFAVLEGLSEHFTTIRKPQKGQYVHLFMVAVKASHEGRGIAPAMNRVFFKHVMEKGFTHAVTEPTGEISQHILKNKFGFNELHRINYKDFLFDGKPVFRDLPGHDCAMLLERKLDWSLAENKETITAY